ncbi:MAG: hypothetical protein IT364_24575 [Candidatus Hydrogenedentes bacterium]|nr:hypothetical protein [Candidatus Hydrogenedentota bacterium]
MRFGQLNHRVFFDGDGGGGSGGGGDGGKPEDFNYETWLKEQPENVRAALAKHGEESVKGLKAALDAEREARKAAEKGKADRERERKEAEEKALEEQKKFQELADARKAKLDELEPKVQTVAQERDALKAQADDQAAVLTEFLAAELKALNLDEPTKELLTGKSAVEQLRWIAKNREKLTTAKGLPGTPLGSGGNGKLTDEEKRKQAVKIW